MNQVSMAFHNIHLYDQVQCELAERKQTEEALRQSEAKFRELADMLPQIVFETDAKECADRFKIQYGQGTVMLVDDEEVIIEVGQTMLEELGYRALTAGSGQAALDLCEKQGEEIGLVILDMIMPGMGGGETYDRLKRSMGR